MTGNQNRIEREETRVVDDIKQRDSDKLLSDWLKLPLAEQRIIAKHLEERRARNPGELPGLILFWDNERQIPFVSVREKVDVKGETGKIEGAVSKAVDDPTPENELALRREIAALAEMARTEPEAQRQIIDALVTNSRGITSIRPSATESVRTEQDAHGTSRSVTVLTFTNYLQKIYSGLELTKLEIPVLPLSEQQNRSQAEFMDFVRRVKDAPHSMLTSMPKAMAEEILDGRQPPKRAWWNIQ